MSKKKYVVLLASLQIQACLGGIYAWSTFVGPLTDRYGLSPAQSQLIFGATILVFTVTMIFASRLESRTGPRPVAAVGGLFFGAGYLYAASSGGEFIGLFTGLSLLSGIGIGMGYVCPLVTCVKWFPDHKGLVTGISVASFGSGAVLLSTLAVHILRRGVDVLEVFRWIAILYGTLILVGSLFLDVPDKTAQAVRQKSYPGVLSSRPFWILFTGMFCGTFSGLLVIGNLKPIGLSIGIEPFYATMAISAFAVGNGVGRIAWGWVLDRLGQTVIPLSQGVLAAAVVALIAVSGMNAGFVFVAYCIGFGFGGCFVLYAAHIGNVYGSEAVGSIYPLVFLAYGFSGVLGPTVGAFLFESAGSYLPSIILAAVVACGGTVVLCGYAGRRADEPLNTKECEKVHEYAAGSTGKKNLNSL